MHASNLACEPPTEPCNFWLPESPDACEHENCGDTDHSKLCKTCKARLCPEHAVRCECDSYHCETCLFKFQDMELCGVCLKKAEEEEKVMDLNHESELGFGVHIHCRSETTFAIDRECLAESGMALLRINGLLSHATLFLTPAHEAALLAALTKGQPQPVVALLESVPVEDSAVGA